MNWLKGWKAELPHFFSDAEAPGEPVYDPMHIAALVVTVLFVIGVLFWLLWTLLVFEGGLFRKIIPALQVLFGKKTLKDFGWVGYPYELGIFEGFIANTIAFVLTIALFVGVWWILETPTKKSSDPASGRPDAGSGQADR